MHNTGIWCGLNWNESESADHSSQAIQGAAHFEWNESVVA